MSIWVTLVYHCKPGHDINNGSAVSNEPNGLEFFFRYHDDIIKWKHFPLNWPFVLGIHRSPVNSPHKGPWCGALMFSLICIWINSWENNREAGDLRCYCAHYDITVMMNIPSYQHRNPFWKKTIITVLYLHDGNFYCDKIQSSYWNKPLVS